MLINSYIYSFAKPTVSLALRHYMRTHALAAVIFSQFWLERQHTGDIRDKMTYPRSLISWNRVLIFLKILTSLKKIRYCHSPCRGCWNSWIGSAISLSSNPCRLLKIIPGKKVSSSYIYKVLTQTNQQHSQMTIARTEWVFSSYGGKQLIFKCNW